MNFLGCWTLKLESFFKRKFKFESFSRKLLESLYKKNPKNTKNIKIKLTKTKAIWTKPTFLSFNKVIYFNIL